MAITLTRRRLSLAEILRRHVLKPRYRRTQPGDPARFRLDPATRARLVRLRRGRV